jgi:hypothetical protein
LGSFLAGIKAGTLTGIMYMGGIALFNVVLLVAMKQQVLNVISQSFASVCSTSSPAGASSIYACFDLVLSYYVPFLAFVGFFIALLYCGVFGLFYDRLPGGTIIKGETIAGVVGINLIVFGYSGFYFDSFSDLIDGIFFIAWTVVFGYVVGTLYRRYTRVVSFESEDPESMKVSLDGREVTGKSRTLSFTSTHKLTAEPAEGSSFKEWVSSGGISLEDTRSFETTFEVNGDGLVKGRVGKKY